MDEGEDEELGVSTRYLARNRWWMRESDEAHVKGSVQGRVGTKVSVIATLGSEFVRLAGERAAQAGGGWEFLLVVVGLAALIGVVYLARLLVRARKARRVLHGLTTELQLEATRALRDPVLVHQARRMILQTRGDRSE